MEKSAFLLPYELLLALNIKIVLFRGSHFESQRHVENLAWPTQDLKSVDQDLFALVR